MRAALLSRRVNAPLWSIVVLFLIAVAISVAAYFAAVHQEAANDRQWCGALTLLTSKPVPRPADPGANPSRMQTYTLYEEFVMLERHFGC